MHDFTYRRPKSLEEARQAFAAAGDARFLAGGQSLIPMMKHRLVQVAEIIDLGAVPGLDGIRMENETLVIGARALHADVAEHPLVHQALPALAALAAGIGDRQVRNRGTLGGAIANNDPAADYPAAALALGADIRTDRRTIAADDFFTGMFETALDDGEIITAVAFPTPAAAAYVKFPNPASRFAVVGVFVALRERAFRVAITGAGPCAFRATALEAALTNNPSAAIDGVRIDPADLTGDIHATAAYRAHLITVLTKRAVAALRTP